MSLDTPAAVRPLTWILPLTGVLLPRSLFLQLLCAVALVRVAQMVLDYSCKWWAPTTRPERGLTALVGGQLATFGTALYVTLDGLSAWIGLATPGKLLAAILLAAAAGQALQVDLGFLWWSDPLAHQNAGELTRTPLLLP